jgi:hypothetical protein
MAKTELEKALDDLEHTQNALAATVGRNDEARRAEILTLRRQLSLDLIAVNQAIEKDAALASQPVILAEARKRFSDMRHIVALIQAEWPAVMVNQDPVGFATEAQKVEHSNRAFVSWLRSQINDMRRI